MVKQSQTYILCNAMILQFCNVQSAVAVIVVSEANSKIRKILRPAKPAKRETLQWYRVMLNALTMWYHTYLRITPNHLANPHPNAPLFPHNAMSSRATSRCTSLVKQPHHIRNVPSQRPVMSHHKDKPILQWPKKLLHAINAEGVTTTCVK